MNIRLNELKIKTSLSLGGMRLSNVTVNGGGYERGYAEGYNNGYDKGYEVGFAEGETKGKTEGYKQGYDIGLVAGENQGYTKGYEAGYQAGYAKGKEDGYAEGHSVGYTEGETVGYSNGYAEGYEKGNSIEKSLPHSYVLAGHNACPADNCIGKPISEWALPNQAYNLYGIAIPQMLKGKQIKFTGAALSNEIGPFASNRCIIFVKGFTSEGGGVGVVPHSQIEVTPADNLTLDTTVEYTLTIPDADIDGMYLSCHNSGVPVVTYDISYYDLGVADGKQAEYDAFWDAFQDNGNLTAYQRVFNGGNWNEETFKPKYDIKPVGNNAATYAFRGFNTGKSLMRLTKDSIGVDIDFSDTTGANEYVFYSANIGELGVIDTSKMSNFGYSFSYCAVETIKKLIVAEITTFYATFNYARSLVNITFEGVIGYNGLNLQWSTKLSKASIESIINALSTTTSDKTVTLSKTAKEAAFTDEEWAALIATKPNWTISLA